MAKFKRKPVKHEVIKFQFSIDRSTYRSRVTLECGHVQILNGSRAPKLVLCKTCREADTP